MDNQDPGVIASPAEPVVSAPAPDAPAPTGSEAVTNSEQQVPFSRFQEVNDKAKAAEEEAQKLREENEQFRNTQTPETPNDELDPEVEKLLDSYAKKRGLVSQQELDGKQAQIQVQQDVRDLTANPPVAGIPYDNKAVMDYAKANNLPITSRSAFIAAYKELNWDKIVEAERNKAIDGYKSNSGGAETPGSKGAQAPKDQEVAGRNTKERIRSRIGMARQKLTT